MPLGCTRSSYDITIMSKHIPTASHFLDSVNSNSVEQPQEVNSRASNSHMSATVQTQIHSHHHNTRTKTLGNVSKNVIVGQATIQERVTDCSAIGMPTDTFLRSSLLSNESFRGVEKIENSEFMGDGSRDQEDEGDLEQSGNSGGMGGNEKTLKERVISCSAARPFSGSLDRSSNSPQDGTNVPQD